MIGKQEKMGKVVGRLKYLLEKEEGGEKPAAKGRAAATAKPENSKVRASATNIVIFEAVF
jgi:hypothetical protein